ncbi:hypothetical protein BLA60_37255 [Actinophytocola xinjiangensis]|uniref:Uncharacterized protein n=1 Tax=Actinophytocola xinjiangensis TaxID=485602 RepID=A0A7Z0WES9_9PSEU|nr:hypothetical protein [Actinophytocola xinjiangensis]OLF05169.1 hypothetical protein BLA60_37255 [Actinophytocola xinjiangensis]
MATDNRWKGASADAYKATLGPQHTALAAVKPMTDAIDSALGKLAIAICTALGAAFVAFVAELVAAAGATVASEGAAAPATVPAAGVSVAKVAAAVAAVFGVIEGFVLSSVLPAFKDLSQQLGKNAAFPVGAGGENDWPKLTSDLSDSSHRTNRGVNPPWEMSEA